jgi:hypothetical protein
MASASAGGQAVHPRKVVNWPSKVFGVNPAGLNWPRSVVILDLMLIPLVLFWAIGYEQYLLSALFGVLLAGLAGPGGAFWCYGRCAARGLACSSCSSAPPRKARGNAGHIARLTLSMAPNRAAGLSWRRRARGPPGHWAWVT